MTTTTQKWCVGCNAFDHLYAECNFMIKSPAVPRRNITPFQGTIHESSNRELIMKSSSPGRSRTKIVCRFCGESTHEEYRCDSHYNIKNHEEYLNY